ncbi:hypothetical protein RPMA_13575 [Tardiphaga alba]|uniref:Uncharacterized protein n=1 Tax=Tardiphaga alba TaxID=340268 RepID=A0ABX8AAR7_9BRAD|nr:hypothetical protein [Tardiphaga alba]QUS39754.1 hypothetical protein RPMA_13575 [Tardiphaga alba]
MTRLPFRFAACVAVILACVLPGVDAQAQVPEARVREARFWETLSWRKLPDQRGEFVRLCAPHMAGRWAHPEQVCGCLHDHAIAPVDDTDLREALLRGITERGVPTIEKGWIPESKQSLVSATFSQIAKPTLQCMYDPAPID